jgi:hypothetical protein
VLQSCASYADIGITDIMPTLGLCRLLFVCFPIQLLFQHFSLFYPL